MGTGTARPATPLRPAGVFRGPRYPRRLGRVQASSSRIVEPRTHGEAQSGVSAFLILAGAGLGLGLWTMEATDHALPRMLERQPGADLDAVLSSPAAKTPFGGQGDPYIPERYAHAFPGVHLTMLERAGQWVPISSANDVAAAIRALT